MRRRMWVGMFCLLTWTVGMSTAWAQPRYQLQDLGDFLPSAITNDGVILGRDPQGLALWQHGQRTRVDPAIWGLVVNATGAFAGTAIGPSGEPQAFVAPTAAGPYTWLPTAPEASGASPVARSRRGDVVGGEAVDVGGGMASRVVAKLAKITFTPARN
jgi:hypothetical protein